MAETSTALRHILEKIRDDAQRALTLLGDAAGISLASMEVQRLR